MKQSMSVRTIGNLVLALTIIFSKIGRAHV